MRLRFFLLFLFLPFSNLLISQIELTPEEDSLYKTIINNINAFRKQNKRDTLTFNEPLQFAAAIVADKMASANKDKVDEKILLKALKKSGSSIRASHVSGRTALIKRKKNYPVILSAKELTDKWFDNFKIRQIILNPKFTQIGVFSEPDKDEKKAFVSVFLSGYDIDNTGANHRKELEVSFNKASSKFKTAPSNKCKNAERWKGYDMLMKGLWVEKGKIYMEYPNIKDLRRLLKKKNDGIAVDVVQKKQFLNKEYSILDYNLNNKGFMNKVLTKDKILNKNLAWKGKPDKEKRKIKKVVVEMGSFPKGVDNDYELNLVVIQDGKYCKTIIRGYSENYNPSGNIPLGLIPMPNSLNLKPPFEPKNESSLITFVIPFEKNKYEFKQQDIQPLIDALNEPDFIIDGAYIYAYSSIEGDSAANAKLQRKRAESVLSVLQNMQKEHKIQPQIETRDSWGLFLLENEDGPFAYLTQMGKRKAIEKINSDSKLRNELEPILAKERFAQVILDITYDVSGSKEEKFTRVSLQRALKEGNIKNAFKILKFTGKRMKEGRYKPSEVEKWLPEFQSNLFPVINNFYYHIYQTTQIADEEMQEAFRMMSEKEPNEPVYLYNSIYCNLKNDTLVHKEEHRQQVQSMIDGLYGKLDSSLVNALNLEWQFKTLDVLDTMENMQEKMQECIQRIKKFYNVSEGNLENAWKLSYVFARLNDYYNAALNMEPWLFTKKMPEEFLFSYISYAGRVFDLYMSRTFSKAMEKALELNKEKFCKLMGEPYLSFQVLENPDVRRLYLENCK
jgi:outer membrane protein OmpA-like peptidoglycan-associated protein